MPDSPDEAIIIPPTESPLPAEPIDPPPPIEGARATSRGVLWSNRLAGGVIRSGGMLVIIAVVGILAFLVSTVLPLFRSATVVERPGAGRVPVAGPLRALVMDEYRLLAAAVGEAPEVVVFRTDDGSVVSRFPIEALAGQRATVARRGVRRPETVVGTASGGLALLSIDFKSDFMTGDAVEEIRASMKLNDVRTSDGGVIQRRVGGTLLRVKPVVEMRGSVALPVEAGAVVAASYARVEGADVVAVVGADGLMRIAQGAGGVPSPEPGPSGPSVSLAPISAEGPAAPKSLVHALVEEDAKVAWFADRSGSVVRVDLTAPVAIRREVKSTERDDGASGGLTAFEFVLGDHSLALATGDGRLSIWSLVSAEKGTAGHDGKTLRRLHEFANFGSPIVRVVSASTRRTLYLGLADGRVAAAYPTNERVVAEVAAFPGAIDAIAPGSKNDGVLVVGPGLGYKAFDVDNPHPETNLQAVFGEVHYEGYDHPSYIYQSTSSTDESEIKISLWPLVFGTLKAVFYAMILALPLALLAALYTSQFMHPRVRAYVKPGIEVMASLPSVVLGFLAAVVIAPALATLVPAVFATLFGVFAVAFAVGVVWSAIPIEARQSVSSGMRLLIAAALVVLVATAAVASAGMVQRALFSGPANPTGDFPTWLRGAPATGDGLPLLRVALGVVGACVGFAFVPRFLPLRGLRGPARALARVGAWVIAPAALLALLAPLVEHGVFSDSFRWFLAGKGDGKGTDFQTRNSLVVGIAMGFAVIPIVFTIAEDALSSIPDSLRSAALGCGASPWQTATRVVLPAAFPGIFSAVMIGLGRAVGETMIVLMAAGGTAIVDGSIFNGFRALSANIATELPEAPVGGTLYRVLFLSGLILFTMTFVLNTVAEVVRLRFRKKFRGL